MNSDSAAAVPVVVYLAGSGRSGSTLLERVLGEIPGFVNVGELVELFRNLLPKAVAGVEIRCGCGEQLLVCPFWTGVAERTLGGWQQYQSLGVASLQRQVAAQRHLPRLLGLVPQDARFRSDLDRYQGLMRELYLAILAQSGAEVVVDASKWPAQAAALALRSPIDMRIVHLVRDVRGVANSWSTSGVVKPMFGDGFEVMATHNPLMTAIRWTAFQLEIKALTAQVQHTALVRYEDFVADPSREVHRLLDDLGLQAPPQATDHITGTTVGLQPSHGLAGNPSRFRHGDVTLEADDRWRHEMSPWYRAGVASVGLPGLLSCGYGR